MKKFKLIVITALAGSLLLSGCGKQPQHIHVDVNSDFICDECGEELTGVESVSITCENEVAIDEYIELNAIVENHNVSSKVTWSVTNETGSAEVVLIEDTYYLKGVAAGTVVVKATSVADTTKFDTKTIIIYSNGFAPGLIDLGFTYSESFPIEELKTMFGDEATIFAPSEDIASRGLYYIHTDATENSVESFMIIYNLNALKAIEDPEVYRLGLKLDSEYYGADYLHTVELSDGNVGFIDNTFTYEFDTSFISNYYSMTWYRVSDIFEDETKTENTDWTDEQKADMEFVLNGNVLPFVQMGAQYDYETNFSSTYINFFDYSCDYRISDEYKGILVENGFTYSEELDIYFKELSDNLFLYVEVSFTEYGNEIYAYVDNEFLSSWPTDVTNAFTSNVLGSEYTIPAFEYESNSKIYKYEDQSDSYYPQFNIVTQYASYDDIASYVNDLIDECGFDLVSTAEFVTAFLEDPSTCDGKYNIFSLQKGYIQLTISINPLYKPDSIIGVFPAEFYFDLCNVRFEIYNSFGYEDQGIYIDDNKYLDGSELALELGIDYELDIVKCKLSSEAVITVECSDKDVATVTNDGVITPIGIGEATITVTAVDGGLTFTDTIDIVVDYVSVDEYAFISDYFDEIASTGTFTFEESGVVCAISKGTGEDFIIDEENGQLTLNEGNTISFTITEDERITKVGFDSAESNGATIEASVGEFVKDAWYATYEENTFILTVSAGSYTISDISILTNSDLLPVPSPATAISIANDLATKLDEWWTGYDISVDDSSENDVYVYFTWCDGIPSESGYTISEAYENCINFGVMFMLDETFIEDNPVEYATDDNDNECAYGMYSTSDNSFTMFVTLTADTANDIYSVVIEIMEF